MAGAQTTSDSIVRGRGKIGADRVENVLSLKSRRGEEGANAGRKEMPSQ